MARSSTSGTCIGPVALPDLKNANQTWCMTFKDKKQIYGEAGRILPGGRPDGDQDLVGTDAKRIPHVRRDEDVEPVSYNALHRELLEDLAHQVGSRDKIRCIIDLAATEPMLALLALEWRTPYLGVVFNTFHQESIKKRLAQLVFPQYQNAKSPLHKPLLVSLMQGAKPNATADKLALQGIEEKVAHLDDQPAKKKAKAESNLRQTLLGSSSGGTPSATITEAVVGDE